MALVSHFFPFLVRRSTRLVNIRLMSPYHFSGVLLSIASDGMVSSSYGALCNTHIKFWLEVRYHFNNLLLWLIISHSFLDWIHSFSRLAKIFWALLFPLLLRILLMWVFKAIVTSHGFLMGFWFAFQVSQLSFWTLTSLFSISIHLFVCCWFKLIVHWKDLTRL